MRLTQAIDDYLDSLEAERRSHHTVAAYRRDLTTFARFAVGIDLESVTPALLQQFMAHHSVQDRPCGARRARSTINRYRVSLKALFAWAEARWLIQRNPATILKCQRHHGAPPTILSEFAVEHVLRFEYAGGHGTRDRALLSFMLLTGCRLGETIALNVEDIDIQAGTATLRCTKGSDPDRIPISQRCLAALQEYRQWDANSTGPLFITSTGNRLSARQVQRIVAARIQEAGIDQLVTPHTLRHTFATRLYNRTGDIRLVQQALRHEYVTTTQIYAHVDPQRLRKEAENLSKSA